MIAWADGLPGARKITRKMEKKGQEEIERDDGKRDVNIKILVHGGRFLSELDMGAFNLANRSNTIDFKLESFLVGLGSTPANIESLIHDPTFPLTSNPAFALLGPKKRRIQSTWADGLLGTRRMARELEKEKEKERKGN